MSILVWDGKSLATDSAANDGSVRFSIEKMWRLADGAIAGVGTVHELYAMRQWVLDGRKPEQFPKVSPGSHFVIATPGRGLLRYNTSPHGIIHGFNRCAFGSGKDFAYGAFAMNASAEQAVRAAVEYDVHCGGEIKVIEIVKETEGANNRGI